jgi:hypothetical protein
MAWKRIICDDKGLTTETVTINANGKPSTATVDTKLASRP